MSLIRIRDLIKRGNDELLDIVTEHEEELAKLKQRMFELEEAKKKGENKENKAGE